MTNFTQADVDRLQQQFDRDFPVVEYQIGERVFYVRPCFGPLCLFQEYVLEAYPAEDKLRFGKSRQRSSTTSLTFWSRRDEYRHYRSTPEEAVAFYNRREELRAMRVVLAAQQRLDEAKAALTQLAPLKVKKLELKAEKPDWEPCHY